MESNACECLSVCVWCWHAFPHMCGCVCIHVCLPDNREFADCVTSCPCFLVLSTMKLTSTALQQ